MKTTTRMSRMKLVAVIVLMLPLSAAAKVDLLIAAATEAELAPVRAKMSGVKEQTLTSWTFWSGTLAGKSVVLTRTEGDPLNAVAATTLGGVGRGGGMEACALSVFATWSAPATALSARQGTSERRRIRLTEESNDSADGSHNARRCQPR